VAGVASALVLHSTAVGADAFVSVAPIGGNFIVSGNNNSVVRDAGVEAGVLINGQQASVKGLQADVRSRELEARVYLSRAFAQTLSSASFSVTGGGALFQLAPEVNPNGQIRFGFNPVSTTNLGNAVTGLLYTLRTGNDNDLTSGNLSTGQAIVEEAINQISSYRARLGNLQRNQIETNINSQRVALENVTASQSIIRDADMAEEVSRLTRAQVLVQSTQATLQIANSVPTMVLSLLK
jgi:flagellin